MAQLILTRSVPPSALLDKTGADAAALADVGSAVSGVPDLSLDFNNGPNVGDLGITWGFGTGEDLPKERHSWLSNGAQDGSGAINMHWLTGMAPGQSPLIGPVITTTTRYWKFRYDVKQDAVMEHAGSSIKLHRIRAGVTGNPNGDLIGTLLSNQGNFKWFWEEWKIGFGSVDLGQAVPSDDVWHTYELELDYRVFSNLIFKFSLDDVLISTKTLDGVAFDTGAGNLLDSKDNITASPFVETYSCGVPGCQSSINTGDFVVGNFFYTDLA